jgi:sulfate transport system permease protein
VSATTYPAGAAPAAPDSGLAQGRTWSPGTPLSIGIVTAYMSVIVLIPLAAVVLRSTEDGMSAFWSAISEPEAVSAIKLTVITSLIIVVVNAVFGTLLAWVLVRDEFRGKRFVNSIIDLPFALPTIVAGLTLLALYGQDSPLGINITYTKVAVGVALLFVTLPFVVRAVQPVLIELDEEMEEAAASLGATNTRIFRSIILPNLTPAIIAGCALAFARAIGEFGSLVLITGNIPFDTQVASVYIFGRIESDNTTAAAAVAVLLLFISVLVLFLLNLFGRWRSRHERA